MRYLPSPELLKLCILGGGIYSRYNIYRTGLILLAANVVVILNASQFKLSIDFFFSDRVRDYIKKI